MPTNRSTKHRILLGINKRVSKIFRFFAKMARKPKPNNAAKMSFGLIESGNNKQIANRISQTKKMIVVLIRNQQNANPLPAQKA